MFDTVKLVINLEDAGIAHYQIKKLIMDKGFTYKAKNYRFSFFKPYDVVETFYKGQVTIGICHTAKLNYIYYPEMIITFHLSQFDNFSDFKITLKYLFGEFSDYLYFKADIIRLDFCFETLDFNLRQVFTCFRRKYAQLKNIKLYGKNFEN